MKHHNLTQTYGSKHVYVDKYTKISTMLKVCIYIYKKRCPTFGRIYVQNGTELIELPVFYTIHGSSENTMKLHTIEGLIQVGYTKQGSTVLVDAACNYLDLLFLSMPYLSSSFSPLPVLETAGNLLKHCPTGPLDSSISSWQQLTK